jgi:hypothetical protein
MPFSIARSVKRAIRPAVVAYSIRSRKTKGALISAWMDEHRCQTVLLIGAMARNPREMNVGIVEDAVTAGREVKMGINVVPYDLPHPFQVADGCDMPFDDDYVDFALANAIIEHVGGEDRQRMLIAEAGRVARCWAITTPNKWFPVESHTSSLLVHWLPSWRKKRPEFTRLLSRREFKAMLPPDTVVVGRPWSATFTALWARPS